MCARPTIALMLLVAFAPLLHGEETVAMPVNLALGKSVRTLPVVSCEKAFYEALTDGDPKTFAHWRGWSKSALFVLDLGSPDAIDEVRIVCSNMHDYFAGWHNLKPPFTLYVGDTLEALRYVADRNPAADYELVSEEERRRPDIRFEQLGEHGRYVVLFGFCGWGAKLYEIEVLRNDAERTARAHAAPRDTHATTLRELWLKNVSLSGWLPMSTEVVTPHVNWANPHAGGPLRTLFFMHKGQFRVIAELSQRLEMEWDWVPILWTAGPDQPEVPPMNMVEEAETLRKLDAPLDLIVLASSVRWADLPEAVRAALLARVAGGTGLVHVNPLEECLLPDITALRDTLVQAGANETRDAIERFALDATRLMAPLRDDLLRTGRHGQGRVAWLTYDCFLKKEKWNFVGSALFPEFHPYKELPSPAESFYAFLVDLMLRTGGRETGAAIEAARIEDGVLEATLRGVPRARGRSGGLVLEAEVRDSEYRLYRTCRASRVDPTDPAKATLPLGRLRNGANFVNIRLRDVYGAMHDLCVLAAESDAPGIAAVALNPAGYGKQGGPFTVTLDPGHGGDRLVAETRDAYGRVVWRGKAPATGRNHVKLTMDLADAMSPAVDLEVTLLNGDAVLDRDAAVAPCGLDDAETCRENYGFSVWGEAPWSFSKPWMQHVLRVQRDAGVDSSIAYANYYASQTLEDPAWDALLDEFFSNFARWGIRPIYQYSAGVGNYCGRSTGNRLWKPKDEEASHMILGDPAFTEQYTRHVQRNVDVGLKWGIRTYSSGDEQQGWMSYHTNNVIAFRAFIRSSYDDDVEALNRTWGADYKSFDEVRPTMLGNIGEGLSRAEVEEGRGYFDLVDSDEELKAVRGKEFFSLAPWLEYRLFMDHLFIAVHGKTMNALTNRNATLRFGLDGTRYAGAIGFDWPRLLANVNDVVCYNEPVQAEVIRDYKSADCRASSFIGYDTHDKDELWATSRSWLDLIRGLNGVNYYAASGCRAAKSSPHHRFGLVAEDLRLSHSGTIHAREIGEIRQGVGTLILNAAPAPYTAAIRYSQACLAVGDFARKRTSSYLSNGYLDAPHAVDELKGIERLMIDLGLHWRYVTDHELGNGFLDAHPQLELVVIPWGACIDAEEIAALRAFVNGGGTVVATGEFGILDTRGRVHAGDPRRDLFGVAAPNNAWMHAKPKGKRVVRSAALRDGELELPVTHEDIAVEEGSVAAGFADGLPAIVERREGDGRFVFVNASFGTYDAHLPVYVPGPYHDPQARRERIARAHRELFRKALGACAETRGVTITSEYYPEPNAPYYRIGKYGNPDGAVMYGLVQETFRHDYYVVHESRMQPGRGLDCRLRFDSRGHIYDVRAKAYLGEGNEIAANIHPGEAKVYGVLPYRVVSLDLTVEGAIERGKELALGVAVGRDGEASLAARSVVHVEVFDPAGQAVRHYARNLVVDGTAAATAMRFALNDTPGAWRITAEDTVSGVSDSAFLVVR